MRLANIIVESHDIRQRYRHEPYEFLTDVRTKLIDPKKVEQLLVHWLIASKAISLGVFLNDIRVFKSLNLKNYPAVKELVNSYKTDIVKGMLTLLSRPDNPFLTDPRTSVQFNIDTVRDVGLEWPEFAIIERSINSKQLKENDYDDADYDDHNTPDIQGAKEYIQHVKTDFDQFGELPINGIMNDLEFRYNLDRDSVDQVLQPIKSDIIIYINTEFGKGGYSIYGAIRRLDKLHRGGINWPEMYRMLDNQKHSIVKYILEQIKINVSGMIMEMAIILTRMGVSWPELVVINRSIDATKKMLPESVDESFSKEQLIGFAQKAFERGTVYGLWKLDIFGLKASEVPGAKESLDADKDRFIISLLRMLKQGDKQSNDTVKYAVKNYRHHGLDWPELDVIERSVMSS